MPTEHKEQGKNVQRTQSMSGGVSVEHEEQKINVNSHFVEFLARQPGNVA
jgi:vacuolar-type H+-ATPase subunit E/Vma4